MKLLSWISSGCRASCKDVISGLGPWGFGGPRAQSGALGLPPGQGVTTQHEASLASLPCFCCNSRERVALSRPLHELEGCFYRRLPAPATAKLGKGSAKVSLQPISGGKDRQSFWQCQQRHEEVQGIESVEVRKLESITAASF